MFTSWGCCTWKPHKTENTSGIVTHTHTQIRRRIESDPGRCRELMLQLGGTAAGKRQEAMLAELVITFNALSQQNH